MNKLKRISRNSVAIATAVGSGFAVVAAPFLAIAGIWTRDIRWAHTGIASLVLGAIAFGLAWILYDDEPETS